MRLVQVVALDHGVLNVSEPEQVRGLGRDGRFPHPGAPADEDHVGVHPLILAA